MIEKGIVSKAGEWIKNVTLITVVLHVKSTVCLFKCNFEVIVWL